MDETSFATLTWLGHALLFRLDPGTTFIGVVAGVSLVGSLVRHFAGDTPPLRVWIGVTGWLERVTITLALLAMIALSLVQIVLRNLFDSGLVWIDPLLRHLVLWVGFMGAMLAAAYDRHITIDALSRLLSGRAARVVHGSLRVGAALVAFVLSNAGYLLVRDEFEFESASFLDIPTWALMMVIPVAFGVIGYRFLVSAWRGPIHGTSELTTAEDAFVPSDDRAPDPGAA